MNSKIFLKFYLFSLSALLSVYFLERVPPFSAWKEGLLLGALQCVVGVIGAVSAISYYWRSPRGLRVPALCLAMGLFAFAMADFFWAFLFYYQDLDRHHWLAVSLTQLPYGFGYLAMTFAIGLSLKALVLRSIDRRIFFLVSAVLVPFFFKFIALPTAIRWVNEGWSYFLLGHSFNSLASAVLLFVSFVSLLMGRDLFWGLVASGCSALVLENWSFRAEMLLFATPQYGFYDYAWAFGILTVAVAVTLLRSGLEADPTERYERSSLVSQGRLWFLGAMLTSLTFVTVTVSPAQFVLRFIMVGAFAAIIFSVLMSQFLSEKIQELALVLSLSVTDELGIGAISDVERELPLELRSLYRKLFESKIKEKKREEQIQSQIAQIASQVAHDIRSPLAALDNFVGNIRLLPEDDRVLIRMAVNRIKDIANNLIEKNRERLGFKQSLPHLDSFGAEDSRSGHLLSSLVESIITEKRLQFRSKIEVEIDFRVDSSSYGFFVAAAPSDFKRVLSNLINNAVEAIDGRGSVNVSTGKDSAKNFVFVRVADSGKGISPAIISKLGERGATFGKDGGSGLGLYHARKMVEGWGGRLEVESELGVGTVLTINVPEATPPGWFVSELSFASQATIVVLDDDASIHGIWQTRLDALCDAKSGFDVLHFSAPEDLIKWVRDDERSKTSFYFIDYEFEGHKVTGLDLINELKLWQQSVLVTSHFEEPKILEGCKRAGVRLIPKGLAGFVPIVLRPTKEVVDVILVDDDPLVRLVWSRAASHAGLQFRSFGSQEEFISVAGAFGASATVYIDCDLGNGVRGEDITLRARELGFQKIYLSTGYDPGTIRSDLPISGVIGKVPPF
jgi:signal transduction histidine kinase/FixJ family two-component response regulator